MSALMGGISLTLFFHPLGTGRDIETARTVVVDALVVCEIFYLFKVRYLHMRSFTLRGAIGTRAVLVALGAVAMAQLLFTCARFMRALFDSRGLQVADAMRVVLCGVALLLLLEAEKVLARRLGWFD